MDTDARDEVADILEARSGAYQTLARLWIEEVDEALWQGLVGTAFPAVPDAPRLDSAYRRLEGCIRNAAPDVLKELAIDYALLCRGANPVEGADPYESVHRNQFGLMMQDEWESVLRFYREVGLERSPSSVEPEDHLGIELECMARLCQRLATAYGRGDKEGCQDLVQMQLQMLEGHLLVWVPRFVDAVLRISKTEFYKSVATITQEYLLMDREFLQTGICPL